MSDEQTRVLSLKAAYAFGSEHGLEREVNDIRDKVIEWDSPNGSSLRRGYVVELFEKHGVFEGFKARHWALGNTPTGETQRRRYLQIKRQYEDFLERGPESGPAGGTEEPPDVEQALEFALEAHLRDFLARNLDRVEPGLRLYESDGRNGIEFPVDGGRIDLLAIDHTGKYVVIELKLSQGRNKTLGQLLYYMGWIDQHMDKAPSRGIIIASEITQDLSVAVSRVPGVSLARYRMSFAIEPVEVASGLRAG
ncbi:MAG: endonuclease NucS [Acidobacteriota bacterium]|nr:endonuclease NucS [Acidobacteriota bacterium]